MSRKRRFARNRVTSEEPHVLVGLGKHDLTTLMAEVNSPEGEEKLNEVTEGLAHGGSPPRYRPERICSQEQVNAFCQYVEWFQKKVNKPEKK